MEGPSLTTGEEACFPTGLVHSEVKGSACPIGGAVSSEKCQICNGMFWSKVIPGIHRHHTKRYGASGKGAAWGPNLLIIPTV